MKHAVRAVTRPAVAHDGTHFWAPQGRDGTLGYRLYLQYNGCNISWWHDVPLSAGGGLYNFVCEMPRLTLPKIETTTDLEAGNPMFQDRNSTGVNAGGTGVREYPPVVDGRRNRWNYGALPQVWEDPAVYNLAAGNVLGDNDLTEVIEIGDSIPRGSVVPVKILGALALIDEGQLDWKLIAIRAADPLAARLNNGTDIDRVMPGLLDDIRIWFRDYKRPNINRFGFGGRLQSATEARRVIADTHGYWQALITGGRNNTEGKTLDCANGGLVPPRPYCTRCIA